MVFPHKDHRPSLGSVNGIATLDADGILTLGQRPPNNQSLNPGEWLLESRGIYPNPVSTATGLIQYTQVSLPSGKILTKMRCFINSGGSVTRNVRLGIYDQTDVTNITLVPNNKVKETAITPTNITMPGFLTINFATSFTVGTAGYYWLAFISDNSNLSMAGSSQYRAGFMPMRQQSGTGATLPATASGLSNPQSSIIYVAAVE